MAPFYQVQLKFLSTGRLLNVDVGADNWIRNLCAAGLKTQTFHLRKMSNANLFVLEGEEKWVGFRKGARDIAFWAAAFDSVKKEMAFEIITNTKEDLEDRIRIKVSKDAYIKLYENNDLGSPIQYVPKNMTWSDDSVLSMKLIPQNVTNAVALGNILPLDGVKVQIKSEEVNKFVYLKDGGKGLVTANTGEASGPETFELWAVPGTNKYVFRASNGQFMGLYSRSLVAISEEPDITEAFEIIQQQDDFTRVRIKASNKTFLQIVKDKLVSVDGKGEGSPFVFSLRIVRAITPDSSTSAAIQVVAQRLRQNAENVAKVLKLGLWGGVDKGTVWDMGNIDPSTRLKEVNISTGVVIDGMSFKYQTGDGNIIEYGHKGGRGGDKGLQFALGDGEYINSITGFYSTFDSQTVISMLTFKTNTSKTYGPCGKQNGTAFSIPVSNGRIIGFHGRANRFINAFGVYVAPN